MRRTHLLAVVLVVPALLLAAAFLSLASAQTLPPAGPDACQVGQQKWVEPTSLNLGETVKVTMVMTHTCPPLAPPMDLMFLVDISNSMTSGDGARIDDPCGPGAADDPFPTKPPTVGPGTEEPPKEPTLPGGITEPTVCPTRPPALPIVDPTNPAIINPPANPTNPGSIINPTPANTPGPPTTPDPRTPPATPTGPGGVGPTRPPIVNPQPGEQAGTEDLIREAQAFIREFVKEPDVQQAAANGRLRVGLIAFESRPHTISGLTSKLSRISSGTSRLENLPHGTTNVAMGFYRANQIMDRGQNTATGATRVIVLISDGKFDARTIRGLRKREGVVHLAVAMGKAPDMAQLGDIANERRLVFDQRGYPEFMVVYRDELLAPRAVGLFKATVRDELAGNMAYVVGSAAPTSTVTGQVIEWVLEPPASPVTMTYEVEPLEPGRWPVSVEARADWWDTAGRSASDVFPQVEVDVRAPTPTVTPTGTLPPTSTATATEPPTATPTRKPPEDIYLPYAVREPKPKECIPSEQTVDVGMVIDTSDSMLEVSGSGATKLAAAIDAAITLAEQLKLDAGGDQVAVIGFNSQAYVRTSLTPSQAVVNAALASLVDTQARGTRIDLALQAALVELTAAGRRPDNSGAVVLLTDGRQEGSDDDVRAAANALKAAGITLHTVGLGNDVDGALLAEIASSPDYYYYSPDADGLEDIYHRIAAVIPCP